MKYIYRFEIRQTPINFFPQIFKENKSMMNVVWSINKFY